MPEYLMRLRDGLRAEQSAEAGGVASWENVAQRHAETRVRLGFDIDQLVHEFIVLRQVLFSILEEEGMHLELRQWARLADLVEGAIAAAVKSYVRSRDDQLRRQEAEHIGFITHELRNPLSTAILGAIQLRRTLEVSPDQERLFGLVEKSHQRLADLIAGVLIVERDAHELHPQPRAVALGQLLDEMLAGASG